MSRSNDLYLRLSEAFAIFARYPGEQMMSMQDYELYAGPDPTIVDETDIARLKELGWQPEYQYDCFYWS